MVCGLVPTTRVQNTRFVNVIKAEDLPETLYKQQESSKQLQKEAEATWETGKVGREEKFQKHVVQGCRVTKRESRRPQQVPYTS